jgi:hypothetical protein
MRQNLRWIEEAEARQMRELAAMQGSAAEMRLTVVTIRRERRLPRWLRAFLERPSPRISWNHAQRRHQNGV